MRRASYVRPTTARIDLGALSRNFRALTRRIPAETRILAVVKANGYGHGIVPIARECVKLGAVGVGVADISEALVLREAGFTAPVVCLGALPEPALPEIAHHDLTATLYTMDELQVTARFARRSGQTVRAHLKFDTGMNRLGFAPKDVPAVIDTLETAGKIRIEGIFTHLAETENEDRSFTNDQIRRFRGVITEVETRLGRRLIRHAANSGGVLGHPDAHFDWVRPGIALYGYPPLGTADPETFRPVLTWRAPILQIKTIAEGETVGYNRRFQASRPTRVGTVAVGYGDGFLRGYGAVGVGVGDRRCPILGTVCMDLLMVDLSDHPEVREGDSVTLIDSGTSGGPDAAEIAKAAGTISYEVLTNISARVTRETVHNDV